MKKILIILLALGFIQSVKSQEITRNNIYAELGGAAMMYSVNYERLLTSNRNINFPFRIGLSYTNTNVFDGDNTIGVPISISLIKNLNKSFYFEAGVFVTAFFYEENYNGMGGSTYLGSDAIVKYMPGASIGFRRQPEAAGVYYHLHLQVQFIDSDVGVFPGFGLGYAF